MNRDGERYIKELEKKVSRGKKVAKLQKRTVAVLAKVSRQRDGANKIVRILNKRIEQVEKVNERLIRENLSQSLLIEELRRRHGGPSSLPTANCKIPKISSKSKSCF